MSPKCAKDNRELISNMPLVWPVMAYPLDSAKKMSDRVGFVLPYIRRLFRGAGMIWKGDCHGRVGWLEWLETLHQSGGCPGSIPAGKFPFLVCFFKS